MKIWIDADATLREVKEIAFRAAKRLGLPTILVANKRLQCPPGYPLVSAVWVDGGSDVADRQHTDETIGERLSIRNAMDSLRGAGVVTGGPAPFDARAKRAFAASLDRVLTRLQRTASRNREPES